MQTVLLDTLSSDFYERSIQQAVILLKSGELVAFPTETVYGLGADARNSDAIKRVFFAKGRPSDNPLIVHVANFEQLIRCGRVDQRVLAVAQAFMPGPLTIVIPALETIPDVVRAGLPTVAVRIPFHPVAIDLISRTGPLVAPSANLSGRPSPTTADHVVADLSGRIAAVLDGGPCQLGIESTVVDLSTERAVILRPGIISREEIEQVLGDKVTFSTPGDEASPRSPGTKYRHYAPSVPVRLLIQESPPELPPDSSAMVLTTSAHLEHFSKLDVHLVSEKTLYILLRKAEQPGVSEVIVYVRPNELQAGLLNRLRKAAGEE